MSKVLITATFETELENGETVEGLVASFKDNENLLSSALAAAESYAVDGQLVESEVIAGEVELKGEAE